jgi:hypothetical protein
MAVEEDSKVLTAVVMKSFIFRDITNSIDPVWRRVRIPPP